jgi:hypothetical protein
MIEDELLKNIKTMLKSAEMVYLSKDYTSATILFFKVAFGVLDIILLKTTGKTPKNHTERFRMLQNDHPDLYTFLDKFFKIYRDTYSITIDKETCEQVRKSVKELITRYSIQI